jgi:hypothetical protein
MRNLFALALLGTAVMAYSQDAPVPRPAPGFTLTLSEGRRDGTMVAYQQVLVVKLTNISKQVIDRALCDSHGEQYNLEIVYNGVPVEKTDDELKWRKQHETGVCSWLPRAEHTKPGEDRFDTIYYNTTKPGTYEITATRETFPGETKKTVTVRSNTLTIVVPEPEPTEPE